MDKDFEEPNPWRITVRRSVLNAAEMLEKQYGEDALSCADGDVWRYLMNYECMAAGTEVVLTIIEDVH